MRCGGWGAADELEAKGFSLLDPVRQEPWGQSIAKLLSIEGSIVGISYAPSLHDWPDRRRGNRPKPS
jgi:hypothetical protein